MRTVVKSYKFIWATFVAAAFTVALTACGGGGGSTTPTAGNSGVGAPASIIGYTVVQTVTRNDGQPNVIGIGKTITYSFINASTILGAGLYTLPTTSWSYSVNGNVANVSLVYGNVGWAKDTWTFTSPTGGTYHSDTGLASGTQGWHEGTFVVTQYSGPGAGKTLSSISITPATSKFAVGMTTTLTATGTYSDGTTADITTRVAWTSAAPAVASVGSATGIVTGVAGGTTAVTASMYGITSPASNITIISAPLTSISITPATASIVQGATRQFAATGTYSDGSSLDITPTVTWASANTTVATINATSGLATGVAGGTSAITATLGAVSGNATMTVTLSSIGGTVRGLSTGNSIVLQNNGGDNLTVAADGAFTFATPLQNGATYNATILTPPTGQPCSSTYGAGTVNAASVANINIFCGPVPVGLFTAAASITNAHKNHTATLLPNGKVLVAGGMDATGAVTASTDLYDPATNTWTSAGNMSSTRFGHTATLLANGKVLVAGGGLYGFSAELYDPATNTWAAAGSMAIEHMEHTATLLPNGKVLVAGGYAYAAAQSGFNAELYDPVTNTWAAAGSMATMRFNHTATLLPSGKVLVAGGKSGCACNGFSFVVSTELYDPATNTWMAAGNLASTRAEHTATLLPNGKVLVAGGWTSIAPYSSSAELYDPATNTWSATGNLVAGRRVHAATLLPTGKVLVAGGIGFDMAWGVRPFASAELYDPVTNTWAATGSLAQGRSFHTATLLSNGKVLVVGGEGYVATSPLATLGSTELYW